MKRSVATSQIVCWVAAGLTAIVAALLTWPKFGSWIYSVEASEITPLLSSVAAIAAALMWGWTVLLVWASFRRWARREVLIITIVPVMAGLFYNAWLDYSQRGLRGDLGTWVLMILEALVIVLLLYGIWSTWRETRAKQGEAPPPSSPITAPTAQPFQPPAPAAPLAPVAQSDEVDASQADG